MSSREDYLYKQLFEGADYFECNNMIHIGSTTGTPCKWTAHPYCGKRLRKWVGFSELHYAKTSFICDTCFLLYAIKKLGQNISFLHKKPKMENEK